MYIQRFWFSYLNQDCKQMPKSSLGFLTNKIGPLIPSQSLSTLFFVKNHKVSLKTKRMRD